jgi:hypothetical protein
VAVGVNARFTPISPAKGGHVLPHLRRPPRAEEFSVRRKFLDLCLRFRGRYDVIRSEVC